MGLSLKQEEKVFKRGRREEKLVLRMLIFYNDKEKKIKLSFFFFDGCISNIQKEKLLQNI